MKRILLLGVVLGAMVFGGVPARGDTTCIPGPCPEPTITASDPASPANNRTPRLIGDPAFALYVYIFISDKDCRSGSGLSWHGPAERFSGSGIDVYVPDDSTTAFYVRGSMRDGTWTGCSDPFIYVERSTPTIEASDPVSPANENAPRIIGDPEGNLEIYLYSELDACLSATGFAWSGHGHQFRSPGIQVTVPDDSTTVVYARGSSPEGWSGCSAGFEYRERTAPFIIESVPVSPANDSTPLLKGAAMSNDLVEIYTDLQQCRDGVGAIWNGTAAQFASPGIEVLVPDNSITTFYARGISAWQRATSGCSEAFTYEEDSNLVSAPSARKDCFALVATILGTEDNDVIYGTPGPDVINGLGGNDVIYGLDGDDTICGGTGSDEIHGGAGADRVAGDFIASHERPGNDTIYGDGGDDSLFGDFIDAGPGPVTGGNDMIYGGPGADFIKGDVIGFTTGNDERTGGDDGLFGEDGADFILGDGIEGGPGADRLTGGNDHLDGGNGNDKLRGDELVGGAGADTVTGGQDILAGGAGDDSLRGDDFDSVLDDAPDRLIGNADVLLGEAGNDRLEGDYLRGGPGEDVITSGRDSLRGGSGNDVIIGDAIFGEAGTDIVHLLSIDILEGEDGNDQMFGDGLDDREVASGGNDRLIGGRGDDYLNCEEGVDWASGGEGSNTYVHCEAQV